MKRIIKTDNDFTLTNAYLWSYSYHENEKHTDLSMHMKSLFNKKHRSVICFLFANMSLGRIK